MWNVVVCLLWVPPIFHRVSWSKHLIHDFVSQVIAFFRFFFCLNLLRSFFSKQLCHQPSSSHIISFCRFFAPLALEGLLPLQLFLTGLRQHWYTPLPLLSLFQLFCRRGVRSWVASSSSVTRKTGRTSRQEKCPCSPPWAPWSPASRTGQCSHCCCFLACVWGVFVCVNRQTRPSGKALPLHTKPGVPYGSVVRQTARLTACSAVNRDKHYRSTPSTCS